MTQETTTITDSKGRVIKVRAPDVLSESRFVAMLGDLAGNASYMGGYALPVLYTESIDGDELDLPASQGELDAAIKRLDRHGLGAIAAYLIAQNKIDQKAAAKAQSAQEASVKK